MQSMKYKATIIRPLEIKHTSAVVPRFKQWMSDADWRPEVYRYLPASVIRDSSMLVPDCAMVSFVLDDWQVDMFRWK